MSQDQQKPVDMNEMFRGVAQEVVNANVGNVISNTLITAGNALRAQGYGMLANIDANQLLTKPALLANGSSFCLLPFFRPLPNFFRVIVAHTADGARTFSVFLEDETNTLKTGFLELDDEKLVELERQLNAIGMDRKGYAQLGLLLVEKAVEGYEYFSAEPAVVVEEPAPVVEAVAEAKVEEAAPVAVATPVELGSVIADAAQ